MSLDLLGTFDDDIADILGSDNEESVSKPRAKTASQVTISSASPVTKRKHAVRNIQSEKATFSSRPNAKTKRRTSRMLQSKSNKSLTSESAQISSMSKEEALAMLHSESLKNLHSAKNSNETKAANNNNNDDDDTSDDFDFIDPPSPDHKQKQQDPKHEQPTANDTHKAPHKEPASDDDSNDSILDWLDEPRKKTSPQKKRQSLLPAKSTVATSSKPAEPKPTTSTHVAASSKAVDHEVKAEAVEQWQEWLGLDANDPEDAGYMQLAESAAQRALPKDWEKVNDNLYRNVRTNEKTMTHPLLTTMQNELKLLRAKQKESNVQNEKPEQIENAENNDEQSESNTTSLSSLTVNAANIPSRQIGTGSANEIYSQQMAVPSAPKPEAAQSRKEEQLAATAATTAVSYYDEHKQEAESLVIKNLRMELSESRQSITRLMKDKTGLMEQMEDLNQRTEILLNEQRMRLTQAHKLELAALQRETEDLRALNGKLVNDHQAELMELESKLRRDEMKHKQRSMDEMTLVEQRTRNELQHQIELHQQTVEELKKQHQAEIEMLNTMHGKQLENLRKQQADSGQLDFLISKMETSAANLNKLQRDISVERDSKQKQREHNIEMKEKLLMEKDDEIVREKKAYRELMEKFQALVEETKIEKKRINDAEKKLQTREEEILRHLTESNRDVNQQRECLNEERRKFELSKSRWENLKQNELDDIQRLKNEHTSQIQEFYEEQEMERNKLSKQRQLFNDEKASFMKLQKQLDVERDNLDAVKLEIEQKRHKLSMDEANFERKVQDITSLSRRVYQQSEAVTKMYNDSKQMQDENYMLQMRLTQQGKELKMLKQELLIEKQQIEQERKFLEQEQLSLLTTKRDMLQQIDTFRSVQHQQTKTQFPQIQHRDNDNANGNEYSFLHPPSLSASVRNTVPLRETCNLDRINMELQELRDFVNECTENISNYKEEVANLRKSRQSMSMDAYLHPHRAKKKATAAKSSNTADRNHFNAFSMTFPMCAARTGSFVTNSVQHSRSIKSLSSTLSSRMSIDGKHEMDKLKAVNAMSTEELEEHEEDEDEDEEYMENEQKQQHAAKTPEATKRGRTMNKLNTPNTTDTTLHSSFVSMVNIDTPITIDNKSTKRMKRIQENGHVDPNDSQLPMTPTQIAPMPNLSKIVVTEADNHDHDDESDDFDEILEDEEKEETVNKHDDDMYETLQ
eukprot:CAMPEP_0197020932 /NCGR_PEP_ID=MMETSP1384-20130603/1797_1 /TAXON_ID=29189 /ORGANISM="Ammonia sp." /LENGTH=1201 /DNA_ID=CAMNT_0042448663 /DNA_START=49 /DNA_END=3654 /DNA_ORIENTATION=-